MLIQVYKLRYPLRVLAKFWRDSSQRNPKKLDRVKENLTQCATSFCPSWAIHRVSIVAMFTSILHTIQFHDLNYSRQYVTIIKLKLLQYIYIGPLWNPVSHTYHHRSISIIPVTIADDGTMTRWWKVTITGFHESFVLTYRTCYSPTSKHRAAEEAKGVPNVTGSV